MKKMFAGAVLFALCLPLFADMTRGEYQAMYLNYLKGRNISAQIDADGDVQFDYTLKSGSGSLELTFWIIVDEEDPLFFEVAMYGGWEIESQEELARAYTAASEATRLTYVAKVSVNSDETNIAVRAQTLLAAPEDFSAVFDDMVEAIEQAIVQFAGHM